MAGHVQAGSARRLGSDVSCNTYCNMRCCSRCYSWSAGRQTSRSRNRDALPGCSSADAPASPPERAWLGRSRPDAQASGQRVRPRGIPDPRAIAVVVDDLGRPILRVEIERIEEHFAVAIPAPTDEPAGERGGTRCPHVPEVQGKAQRPVAIELGHHPVDVTHQALANVRADHGGSSLGQDFFCETDRRVSGIGPGG